MAGPKSNVIEYVFQGDILDLQQAIKKINSLLTSSTKKLKGYQDGALTKEQEAKVAAARKLLRRLKAMSDQEGEMNAQQRKRTLAAGREALRQAQQLSTQARKVELQSIKQNEAEKRRILDLTSNAHLEATRKQAYFLSEYSDQLKGYIGEEAYDEIQRAIQGYRAALEDSTVSAGDKAAAVANLNAVSKDYASTLRSLASALRNSRSHIASFNDLIIQTQQYLKATVTSFGFWLQLARKAFQLFEQGIADASAYAESINYLRVVTGEYSEELERFIKLQEAAFGSDPKQLRTTATMFFQIGKALNWSDQQALTLSKSFTQLAQDMASLQNVSLEESTDKLRAGLTGQSKALKAWGIDVQDATIEEWLLTKGINRSMASMNEASQTAARYAYILEKTSDAHGDLARTIESPANQLKILKTQASLFFQNVASFGIPTLGVFLSLINSILRPVNAFLQAFTAASTENFTESLGSSSESLTDLEDDIDGATDAMAGLTAIDEINQAQGGTGIGASFAEDASLVDDSIAQMIKMFDNGAEGANEWVEAFQDLGEALAPVWNIIDLMASGPIDLISCGFSILGEVLTLVVTPISDIVEFFTSLYNLLPDWLQDTIGGFLKLAGTIVSVAAAFSTFKMLASSSIFKSFIGILGGMVKGFMSLTAAIVKNTAALIVNIAKTIWSTTVNWWNNASLAAKIGLLTMGAGLLIVGGVLAASAIMSSKSNETGANEGSIPAMATGAVVTGPTLALVGEGRYDEAVMPLGRSPQFQSMKQDIATETARRVSGGGIAGGYREFFRPASNAGRPIILQLNGKEVARALLPDIGSTQRQTEVKLR